MLIIFNKNIKWKNKIEYRDDYAMGGMLYNNERYFIYERGRERYFVVAYLLLDELALLVE